MAILSARRGCNIGDVEDLVDRDLWDRATKQFVEEPQLVRDGGWGSGGGSMVRSGQGTTRRIFDVQAFRKRLYSYGQEIAA